MDLDLKLEVQQLNIMKRIILLFANLLVIAVVATAQTNTTMNKSVNVYADKYANTYEGDFDLPDGDTLFYVVNYKTDVEYLYDSEVTLSAMTGAVTYAASVTLQGKLWDSDSFADIGSAVAFAGTQADTTIKFTQHTTAQFYQYLRWVVDGDSVYVDHLKNRVWK